MTRSEQLNQQYRRIFLVSLLGAGLLHAGVVFLNPSYQVEVTEPKTVRLRLELVFPEPQILTVDGSEAQLGLAPDLAVANWGRVQWSLRENWPEAYQMYRVGGAASLRLRLDSAGHVLDASLFESSGDPTKDQAFLATAREARYHSITPDLRWQEMELVQPLRVERPLTPLQLWVARSSADTVR